MSPSDPPRGPSASGTTPARRKFPPLLGAIGSVIAPAGRPDEAALVSAAAAGDNGALGALLEAQYDRCYAVCRRILTSPDDALDATQEAMIAVARGIARFDGRSSFSTWCYRVATNAALDERRRQKRRPVLLRGWAGSESGEGPAPERSAALPPSGAAAKGPADPVGEPVAARLAVGEALSALPEEQRVAVVLRDIADLEYAEIAAVLAVPIGTVRSRIARGRTALATALAEPSPPAVAGDASSAGSAGRGNFPATGGVGKGEEPR